MIIPCINSTSFGECGGSVALVDGGSVRVGWPGAPGCTTTGVAGSACCAHTGSEHKPARVTATSPLRHAPPRITDWSLRWPLKQKDFIGANGQAFGFMSDKLQFVASFPNRHDHDKLKFVGHRVH